MSNTDLRKRITELEGEVAEVWDRYNRSCHETYRLYLAGLDISDEEFVGPEGDPADTVRAYVQDLKKAAKVLL